MAKIFIKPNPNITPLQGYVKIERNQQRKDVNGNKFTDTDYVQDKYSRAPGTNVRICANPSKSLHGNLASGMLEEILNPYAENQVWYDKKFQAVLEGKQYAKLQHILEFKHGKEFNYLTNQVIDIQEAVE